jgi:hypothetical protein
MRHGIESWRATGAEYLYPYCLGLLAEARNQAGAFPEVSTIIAEALSVTNKSNEQNVSGGAASAGRRTSINAGGVRNNARSKCLPRGYRCGSQARS